ncbi:MAG: hypothetical protein ABI340_08715 [Nitrososphaera sp.]
MKKQKTQNVVHVVKNASDFVQNVEAIFVQNTYSYIQKDVVGTRKSSVQFSKKA